MRQNHYMDADLARRLDDATFPAFDLWSYHREVDDAIKSLVDEYRATCGRTFLRFHYNTYFNAAKFLALNLFQARLYDHEGFLILSKDENYYSGEFFNPSAQRRLDSGPTGTEIALEEIRREG